MNVSVIIPAWNAADTIAATLQSLITQSHAEWEAVVVDDGSTDATADIARRFADRDARIRMVQQQNGGEAAARNAGLATAVHDWLLFLDADDWIAPQHLARLTHELAADASLDAVFCSHARVAADGTRILDPFMPPAGDMFATWARRSAFPIHACIVRRRLVEDVGRFDTTLRKSADWDLWQRVARTGARFGAVRDVLAFYRMQPQAASLDARQMLRDGLVVLRRGHAPDARVPRPHPDHARGAPPDQVVTQAWYLLGWCAGLMIGQDQDARELIGLCDVGPFPELHPPSIAQCIYDAAPLPLCQPPRVWQELWPRVHTRAEAFLSALESAAAAPDLARRARAALQRLVLRASLAFSSVVDELEQAAARDAALEQHEQHVQHMQRMQYDQAELRRQLDEAQRTRALPNVRVAQPDTEVARLEMEVASLTESRRRVTAEREAVWQSTERRVGDLLLNRLHLRRPLMGAASVAATIGQQLAVARLRVERLFMAPGRPRVAATACWNFPIHSQTFVYQELTQLMQRGFEVRMFYSKAEPREHLHRRFDHLWPLRRRLHLNRRIHERDFEHYRRRLPERVESLIVKVCEASGLSRSALVAHANFLQGFTFTRMLEAWRPSYIHSYFFYDRSLMAMIAAWLLRIPRGVSCYTDHVLRDYDLKVVPLHLESCDIVVATSERIRRELLELAPDADPARIVVKPNGIDAAQFPVVDRREPAAGSPFRLVTVCRIESKKGLLDLVDAVHILRERGQNVEAHLVGAPDDWSTDSLECKRRLDQRITDLGLWGTVHLEGRHDLPGVLRFQRMAHLFVAPFVETESGDKDGIPTALLEAMATGLPSVVTDSGSITEVIENDREGLIVPQRQPAALAAAIEMLLADPARRVRLGMAAAATARARFDAASSEKILHDRIEQVLDAQPSKR